MQDWQSAQEVADMAGTVDQGSRHLQSSSVGLAIGRHSETTGPDRSLAVLVALEDQNCLSVICADQLHLGVRVRKMEAHLGE